MDWSAFLVAMISSRMLSRRPFAKYVVLPDVCVSPVRAPFSESDVRRNVLSPTGNAGFPDTFGSGR